MALNQKKELTASERRMIVNMSPKAQEAHMEGRSRVERRRLARTAQEEAKKERDFSTKLATRADVIRIVELYNQQKIMPMAARLDATERYLYGWPHLLWKLRLFYVWQRCRELFSRKKGKDGE